MVQGSEFRAGAAPKSSSANMLEVSVGKRIQTLVWFRVSGSALDPKLFRL